MDETVDAVGRYRALVSETKNADMHWSKVMKSTREQCTAEIVSYAEDNETDTFNGFVFRSKRILHLNDGSNKNTGILSDG